MRLRHVVWADRDAWYRVLRAALISRGEPP